MPIIEGALRYYIAGGVSAGTAAVVTLTFGGTAVTTGTIQLGFEGFLTAPLTVSATAATMVSAIDGALEALPNVGTGGVTTAAGTYTAGAGTITCTFGARPVGNISLEINNMAAGAATTFSSAVTTPGVRPVPFAPATGALVVNTTAGTGSFNTGTPGSPTYSPT